jgi:hypothetical protein
MKIRELLENVQIDYRGEHGAPEKDQGSPLYDLTLNGTFPADIYSANGLLYYGNGSVEDTESYRVITAYKNRPNALVTVYRSVPDPSKGLQHKISTLEKQKAAFMRRGVFPSDAAFKNGSQWYEWASNELERLEAMPPQESPKYTINPGDWVAISKRYAIEHGKSHLRNEYKVISKKVKAKDIYCNGDLSEWGYDPS